MKQYIDKSAVVAEMERRNNLCEKIVLDLRTQENKDYYQGKSEAYKEMISFLDTLEVKEVDLEKEIKHFTMSKELYEADSAIKAVAEHFFELGLTQKGE